MKVSVPTLKNHTIIIKEPSYYVYSNSFSSNFAVHTIHS